jgi:hypothetical protein
MGKWVIPNKDDPDPGVDVYTGTPGTSPIALNLSPWIGANHCLVRLGVFINSGAAGSRYLARPSGQTDILMPGDSSHHGMQYAFASSSRWTALTAITSTSGVLQHWTGIGGVNVTVRLLGYCILTESAPTKIETGFNLDGLGWLDEDVSLEMNGNAGLAILTYRSTGFGGGVAVGVRPNGDGINWISDLPSGGGDNVSGSQAQGAILAAQIIDPDGIYEHAMAASSSPLLEIWFEGGIAEGDLTIVNQVVEADLVLAPTDWTELDLSDHVNGRAFVRLKIEHGSTGTSSTEVALRRKGETRNFSQVAGSKSVSTAPLSYPATTYELHCECDEDGLVEIWHSGVTEQGVKVTLVDFILEDVGPQILSVVHTYLNLRVNFNIPMLDDAELRDPSNYDITVTDPTTAYDFEATLVTPESGVTNPTYVDLTMTDCTGGKEYTLVITPDKLQSSTAQLLESGGNTAVFTGVTEDPDVLTAESVSLTQIRVTFSKTMAVNEEFKNPSNYSLTGGLQVRAVDVESESTVLLTTTEQTPGQLYDITVS